MRATALIAEDEAPQRGELRALLAELWPELDILTECADGAAALEAAKALKPQIAFLDIRMPALSGLDVARAVADFAHVVFITAYDEFAVQAFENGATDYLLKPVRRDRLQATIARLQGRILAGERADINALLTRLEARLAETPGETINWITASVGGAVRMLPVEDILFLQAQDKYTRIVTATEEAHIRMPLKELLQRLEPTIFWQISRSAIVRVGAIGSIRRDEDGKLKISIASKAETLQVSAPFAHRFRGM